MSVSVDTQHFRRPFAGWEDPALPEAIWVASSSALGDGGGGVREIRVVLQAAGQARSGNMFSLEQLTLRETNLSGTNYLVETVNMDTVGGLVGQAGYMQTLGLTNLVDGSANVAQGKTAQPLFLGAPFAIGIAVVAFRTDNITGQTFSVFAQGYIWGPRSILAEGGPRRPAGSIFGN